MLVNRLALVVVFRMGQAIRARYRFGGFVGLEAQIADLIIVRPVFQAQAAIAEHQIVVGLQILWINLKDSVEVLDGLGIVLLQEEYSADYAAHYTITRVLGQHGAK